MSQSQTTWTKERVQSRLGVDAKFTASALVALYNRQTLDERSALTTTESNGRGFNARDAEFLSSIAQKLPRYDNRMTARQQHAVGKALKKYHRQLLELIEEKGGKVEWPEVVKAGFEAPAAPEIGMDAALEFGAWS